MRFSGEFCFYARKACLEVLYPVWDVLLCCVRKKNRAEEREGNGVERSRVAVDS